MFILGAYGGCGAALRDALDGRDAEPLHAGSILGQDDFARLAQVHARVTGGEPGLLDAAVIAGAFRSAGFEGLSTTNGLNFEENRCLSETVDLDTILATVFRGLRRTLMG